MSEPLEITIKSQLANVIDQFKQVTREVKTFDKAIETTIAKLDGDKASKGATQIRKSLDGLTTETYKIDENGKLVSATIKTIKNDSGKLKTVLSTAFNVNRLYLYWNLTKRIRDSLSNMLNASIDYTETQNKFNVSMGDGKEDAIKFVNQMTEALGLAKAELMNYQATYKNILSGLGNFTHKESEKISESLVKMALDYSSLFNVETEEAMEKFQSALVGSIRPIRSDSGYDVSDTTIGAKAKELGLDRTVGQLNQMEKRILRIIVLMDQLKNTGAFGDLARTIEQPANQIRVLKAQVQELGVWIGNVFMGTIGKILPYINAFVMVLKELVKTLAIFVGYEGDNTSLSDVFESVEDSAGGVSNNIGDANKKAKELRKTLMGFDVLNVINTPSDTSSSSGSSSGVSSIDPAILNALEEYDSMMENVRMKATDIRDRIMDWLGFIKRINPLTGEIEWFLRDGLTNLEKILDVIKAVGIAIATWKIGSKVSDVLGAILGWDSAKKTVATSIVANLTLAITGFYVTYQGIKHMLDGDISVFSLMQTFLGSTAGVYGIGAILAKALAGGKHAKAVTAGSILKIALPVAFAITVISFSWSAIKKNFDKMFEKLYGEVVENTITLSQRINTGIYSVLYEFGTLLQGAIVSIKNFFGLLTDEEIELLEANKKVSDSIQAITDSYEKQIETIKESADDKLIEIEYATQLYNELTKIVDSNGEIQEGYENRAKFILGELNEALGTEYQMNGNIIKNYKDMNTEIQNIIAEKKKEIEVEAYSELYKESLKKRIELSLQLKEAIQNNKEALQLVNDEIEENGQASFEANENLMESKTNLENLVEQLEVADGEIDYYSQNLDEKMADANSSVDGAKKKMTELKDSVTEDFKTMGESSDDYSTEFGEMKNDITNDITNQSDGLIKTYQDAETEMKNLSTSAETETENIKNAFNSMDSIRTSLDGPLGALLSTLNPTFGIGLQLVNMASNLASKISEKLNITANFSAKGEIGGGGGKIGARANGGPVAVGEMFIAREAGPELVGKIGNTTTVMNNQQIVQAVSQGVAQAVSQVLGSGSGNTTVVEIDGREIARAVESRLSRNQNVYGTT